FAISAARLGCLSSTVTYTIPSAATSTSTLWRSASRVRSRFSVSYTSERSNCSMSASRTVRLFRMEAYTSEGEAKTGGAFRPIPSVEIATREVRLPRLKVSSSGGKIEAVERYHSGRISATTTEPAATIKVLIAMKRFQRSSERRWSIQRIVDWIGGE